MTDRIGRIRENFIKVNRASNKHGGKAICAKQKVEPKSTATKSQKAAAQAAKKAERKTQHFGFSDAHIKHNVTRLR